MMIFIVSGNFKKLRSEDALILSLGVWIEAISGVLGVVCFMRFGWLVGLKFNP